MVGVGGHQGGARFSGGGFGKSALHQLKKRRHRTQGGTGMIEPATTT